MSQFNLNSLSEYTKVDSEKQFLIGEMFPSQVSISSKEQYFERLPELKFEDAYCDADMSMAPSKVCPKCGRRYYEYENFCFDCSVRLVGIGLVNVKDIDVAHGFEFEGSHTPNDFDEIFTKENLVKINNFNFKKSDFKKIIANIKTTALKNLDKAIKDNEIDLDSLMVLEKIILFVKSFVDVEYKSYGMELGYYNFNRIFIDDRQLDSLQITTMLHELTHFLIKEILTHILCSLLDLSKTREIESIVAFTLTFTNENCLIDEYAAHTVEGRFTLFGFQDYSSFLNIQKSLDCADEDIEMLKTIGNTLANVVKGIIESFVDDELLSEIKTQFKRDIFDDPNYDMLKLENCTLLNDTGLFKAIQFILLEGFVAASDNVEKLREINQMW